MSKILIKEVYDKNIVPNLNDKKTVQIILNHLDSYMNRNAALLTTAGPTEKVIFSENDKSILFHATEVVEADFVKLIKTVPGLKSQQNIVKTPYYTLNALCTRYAILAKDEKLKQSLTIGLLMSIYPSLQAKYFKYTPNKDMMEYTINNLSNKFKIKQHGIFYFALLDIVINALKLHESRLIRGDDNLIFAYVIDVKTRLNSVFRKLAGEFYENSKKGMYLAKEEDNFDEDNYNEYDSNTYAIARVTDKVTAHIVTNGPNSKIVEVSAKMNQVSVSELRNYTDSMINKDHMGDISKLTEHIVTLFIMDGKHSVAEINSANFIVFSLDIYRTSNVKNTQILAIKAILDNWMKDLGTYEKTNRKATINNFRRALYCFMVYSIQHANMQ